MSIVITFLFVTVGISGFIWGLFIVYSIITHKRWVDRFNFPFTFGSHFLKKIYTVWFGIAVAIVCGCLAYAVIMEFISVYK